MHDVELFQRALGLEGPWEVVGCEFDAGGRWLDLRIAFPRGSRFACPECGLAGCAVKDAEEKAWRHLDFLQHRAHLTARVPRVVCAEHGVRQARLPWARERSGSRRGQDCVSVFADLDAAPRRVRDRRPRPGHGPGVSCFLETHGGEASDVREVCQDMSKAFLAGTLKHLPAAEIAFDRHHVRRHLSKALDEVRRAEAKTHKGLLKSTRYLWLKRPGNLTEKQQDWLDELLRQPLEIVRAYELSLRFDPFYELDDPDTAEEYLRRWITEVRASQIGPLIKFTQMLEDHWLGVVRWHHSHVSNGLLEGLNSLIQAAKRRARGYRTKRNYLAMVYLVAGKLNLGRLAA